MSLSALLRRALGAELAEAWPEGTRVARVIYVPLEGVVAFVDDGWIYWVATDRHMHASRPDALRKV